MSEPPERHAASFEPGDVLFHEGDAGDLMFVVQSGEIELRRRFGEIEHVLAVVGPGGFVGEMALLSGRPRSATAVARTHTRVLRIDQTTLEGMLKTRPELAVRIILTLAERLERANQQIELLLLASPNHRVAMCLRQLAEEAGLLGGAGPIHLTAGVDEIARRVTLTIPEVAQVIERLSAARLVTLAASEGLGPGLIIPEVARLLEFIEFLGVKERHRRQTALDPPAR